MARFIVLILLVLYLSACKFGATLDPFYQAVLRAQPRNPGAVYLQGQLLLSQGQYEKSANYFARLTKLSPADPAGWIGLGQAELEQEHPVSAEKAFRQALAVSGKPIAEAEFGLASALIFQGKLEAARAELDRIEQERGTSATLERLRGDLAFMAHLYDESLLHYQKSLVLRGSQPDLQRRVDGLSKYLGSKAK